MRIRISRYLCATFAGALVLLANVAQLLGDEDAKPKRLLLLGQSPDGHPAGTHEYMPGVRLLADALKQVPELEVRVLNADNPWTEGPDQLRTTDGVVLFVSEGAKWIQEHPRRMQAFSELAARGGGFVVLHWGMGTRDATNIDDFLKLFGACHGGPDRKYKVVKQAAVRVVAKEHPVTRGIDDFTVDEEFYYRLKFVKAEPPIVSLLETQIDDNPQTVCWAWERADGGRSFGFSGCHFHDNWQHEQYRRLVAQAALWSLKLSVPEEGLPLNSASDSAEPASIRK